MKSRTKLVIASVIVALFAVFIFTNMDHRAELRLINEFEVGSLTLLGVGFFAGAASVFMVSLWRRWRKDTHSRALPGSARNSVLDKDL